MTEEKRKILNLINSAFFLSLAYVMPFLTGQIPTFGKMLCPMHIPVLLCGFICGWKWGLACGITAPLLRSLTLGMPALFPMAICMAFELAAYGAVSGIMYKCLPQNTLYIYVSLISAMLAGRGVWGLSMFVCMAANGESFALAAFVSGAFAQSVPGIIVQIILVPAVVGAVMHIKRKHIE